MKYMLPMHSCQTCGGRGYYEGEEFDHFCVQAKGPTHITGIRDPDSPCVEFVLGDPAGDCHTDGHYVCDECTRRATCDGCGRRPSACECVGGQYGPSTPDV